MKPTDVIGNATLYHGDAMQVLAEFPDAPCVVLCDPPYGISHTAHSPGFVHGGIKQRRDRKPEVVGDGDLVVANGVREWAESRDLPLIMFASPYNPLSGVWRNILVWDKGGGVGGGGDLATCWKRTFELIYIARNTALRGPRDGAVLRYVVSPNVDFTHHPFQKPLSLLTYLIGKITDPNDTVVDPTMGSGSTGVAALRTGRKFVGIEIDPEHYATAVRRLKAEVKEASDRLW